MRFRYHHPIPDIYNVENPVRPLDEISNNQLSNLIDFAKQKGFLSLSYSKLSSDFKKEWNIDWDNIIILKYLMSESVLKMEPSEEKCILEDNEFQEFGIKTFEIADFLRKNNFQAELIHPLDDTVSLRSIAMQSNDAFITRNNMCLFKEGLNISFFVIATSIENLPFKKENDMCWVKKYCSTCGVCIDRCPENAFDEKGIIIRKLCTAHRKGCSICMTICPFFKQGYEKVKKRYDRKCRKK